MDKQFDLSKENNCLSMKLRASWIKLAQQILNKEFKRPTKKFSKLI